MRREVPAAGQCRSQTLPTLDTADARHCRRRTDVKKKVHPAGGFNGCLASTQTGSALRRHPCAPDGSRTLRHGRSNITRNSGNAPTISHKTRQRPGRSRPWALCSECERSRKQRNGRRARRRLGFGPALVRIPAMETCRNRRGVGARWLPLPTMERSELRLERGRAQRPKSAGIAGGGKQDAKYLYQGLLTT